MKVIAIIAFTVALLFCNCISIALSNKVSTIESDSNEFSLNTRDDKSRNYKKFVAAYCGIADYKHKKYFDIAVDSILTNRCFSYLHILIPADSNRMPTMHDSVTCEHIYDLFKGKCSKNGVILLEDSINYHRNSGRIIDTLQVFTYEGQEMPDKDSILEFEWDDHPQNIYYQFLGDNFDAVYFKYIDANNKKYFFQSTIKDRKIKWVQRSKSEYFRAATLSYLAIPLDIALLPFELIFLIYCLIEFHNHPIQL